MTVTTLESDREISESAPHYEGSDSTELVPLTDDHSGEVDESRRFGLEELFFSCTNQRGFITACNPVFARVADYEVAELIGAPHSKVRHPEMPRAVFKLLWDTLKSGQPLAAYVKNKANDGRYYWVMAMAIPVKNGHLSIRLKPTTDLLPKIEAKYRSVRQLERALEADGVPRSKILERSVPALVEGLAEIGFPSYDAFQHAALPKEIASRRATLSAEGGIPATADSSASSIDLDWDPDNGPDLATANRMVLNWVSNLFDNLDGLVSTNEVLAKRSHFLLDLARSIHIFALNAGLASSMLGTEGKALEAVTKQLQDTSKDIVRNIENATAGVEEAIRLIREVAFRISISTLESEMVDFVDREGHESAAESDDDVFGGSSCDSSALDGAVQATGHAASARHSAELQRQMEFLTEALAASVKDVFELSSLIADTVASVSTGGRTLFTLLDLLQFELLAGRIEIARLSERQGFVAMFSEISEQLQQAESEITKFGEETTNAANLIEQFELDKGREVLAHLPRTNR